MTDEHLKQLGRVAVNFQAMELHVALWVWGLIGADQKVGQLVTVHLPFGKLCTLASNLIDHRLPNSSLAKTFNDTIKRSLEAEVTRNQLFHSVWLDQTPSSDVARLKLTAKPNKGLNIIHVDVSAEEIQKLADEMKEIAGTLAEMVAEAHCSAVETNFVAYT